MKYKYSRFQLFGKKLDVPKNILKNIYDCNLSFEDFIKYKLEDKIPISCLKIYDIDVVKKVGIEKAKGLDWELLKDISVWAIFMKMDLSNVDDMNLSLYKLVKDEISPSSYSSKMKKYYSDRYIDIVENNDENLRDIIKGFNNGNIGLKEIVCNWDLFKNKDLSYCLLKDKKNKSNITDSILKEFMFNYGSLTSLIVKNDDIYSFINTVSNLTSLEERKAYVKRFTDDILSNTNKNNLTNDEFKVIFKYSSLEDYLKKFTEYSALQLSKELKSLPDEYIFNTSIPFSEMLSYDVLSFLGSFGLKNVVDFNDECGEFFTKDNCKMLKLMYDMYMHFSSNVHDRQKNIYCDKEGNYISNFNKEQFYESMRRMIIYGPSDCNFADKAPDYREITGEFRVRNSELFISEQADEELQRLFYTKAITPQLLLEHPEYIEYLNGKDLSSCFKSRTMKVGSSNGLYEYENIYKFLSGKVDFNTVMNFITEYSEVLDFVFDKKWSYSYQYEIKISKDDDIDKIQSRINEVFRKLIIEKNLTYPTRIPKKFKETYPAMFLTKDAPKELQDAFYNRTISSEFIVSNPSYKDLLKNVELEILFKYMPVGVIREDNSLDCVNLVGIIKQLFGQDDAFNVMILYGKYIEQVIDANRLQNFKFNQDFSKDDLLNELDKVIFQNIIDGKMKYDENISSHFKNNYPSLFLDENLSKEIRDKFYNREFTLKDFSENPDLLDSFSNTNIVCGFKEEFAWMIPLFEEKSKISNLKRLRIISEYEKVEDISLKQVFKEYILENASNIDMKKIVYIKDVLFRLSFTNSSELFSIRTSLATKLLKTDDPIKNLEKIKNIFIKNNTPMFSKIFLCFKTLYPDLKEFNFDDSSRMSPELKEQSLGKIMFGNTDHEKRFNIIFNDLLRISYRSNNRSFMEYLNNIEMGNDIYLKISKNNFDISNLDDSDIKILEVFVEHLETLFENTLKGTSGEIKLNSYSLGEKVRVLGSLFGENKRYGLKDRIVRSFCYSAGIKSFDELKKLSIDAISEADERGRRYAFELENGNLFKFEEGDFVRGIGDYKVLGSSLNTGNVSKEYLSVFKESSTSDTTPLDVDITMVTETSDIYHSIKDTPTGFGFGNIYVIFKKDNPNFYITRDKDGNLTNQVYEPKKNELFGTSVGGSGYETHWGARTGFAFSDVDYILYKKDAMIDDNNPYDEKGNIRYVNQETTSLDLAAIKVEIAKNGYYIPVIDFGGKLIFSVKEYEELRSKMSGLSYYGMVDYKFSDNLVNEETSYIVSKLDDSNKEIKLKKEKIYQKIYQSVRELGLNLKDNIDGDLTNGYVELFDTGSTGRETNKIDDGDFDFIMRVDREILMNPVEKQKLKTVLLKKFGKENSFEETTSGDLRLKSVVLDDERVVDIDISFVQKNDKITYSSDICLKDRLNSIKNIDYDKYRYVIANIILAKQLLKDAGVYKSNKSNPAQGGLGGIGIENWILQNGGSFIDAAKDFLKNAEGKNFDEFKEFYQIWDFGQNHVSVKESKYPYDNFVYEKDQHGKMLKMTSDGYDKMVQVLKEYVKSYDVNQNKKRSV